MRLKLAITMSTLTSSAHTHTHTLKLIKFYGCVINNVIFAAGDPISSDAIFFFVEAVGFSKNNT